MESSSDGDPATAVNAAKFSLLALVIFMSCHRATPTIKVLVKDTGWHAKPAIATAKPPKKHHRKKLYITFDDGPNKGTRNVLDIVRDEQIPVTFFVVGEHVFSSVAQQQLWDSLQTTTDVQLCNHSYSHAHNHYQKYYQNATDVVHDFERTRDSLGFANNIVRTPGRNIWRIDTVRFTDLKSSTAAADSLSKAGFRLMGWDVEWKFDSKTMSVTSSADSLLREIDSMFKHERMRVPDNLVLLAHDQVYARHGDSIELRRFVQQLKARDEYELALITSYPGVGRAAK